MRNLVTGGAGFIGSHLIEKLLKNEETVICLDNLHTGRKNNFEEWIGLPNYEFIKHDVINPIDIKVDRIWHLACPASPIHYQEDPIKTARTNFLGTYNSLELALKNKAQILFTSTSEVYGDPEKHPQIESYRGNVNPNGIRSCYDEGKRIGETLCFDYHRIHNVDIKVARIFNTYGPKMLINDGRVVTNFIIQALKNIPLTIYGEGSQTRSFCFVDDLVEGLMKLMASDQNGPINLGNPYEFTIIELANLIRNKVNPNLEFKYKPLPQDDPMQRKPDLSLAKELLKWEPKIFLEEGLEKTIPFFKKQLNFII